jgi:hypothetical protein
VGARGTSIPRPRSVVVCALAIATLLLTGVRASRGGVAQCGAVDFTAVAATSPSNAWVLGDCDGQPLIEHWDGRSWSEQPPQAIGARFTLDGIAATSGGNAWAVGSYTVGQATRTLIEHWDGHSWSVQASPSPYRLPSEPLASLASISASSPDNAWAVGLVGGPAALSLHWNGSSWRAQRVPALRDHYDQLPLDGVSVLSSTDAFAVGAPELIEHWNGRAWVRQFVREGTFAHISSVSAVSAGSAWASGPGENDGPVVVLRLSGRRWITQRPGKPPGSVGYTYYGVAAASATNAWLIGKLHSSRDGAQYAYIDHWNGHGWVVEKQLPVSTFTSPAITAESATDAWAVAGPWIAHWDGRGWTAEAHP